MFDNALLDRTAALVARCAGRGLTVATAESCTGGLLAALLTEVAGSSAVFGWGVVAYANAAKRAMLGVPAETLDAFGAVSPQTAEAMARGALARADASLAVSITGIAGPGGGSPGKPVGLVHFGLAQADGRCRLLACRFDDLGRAFVRRQATMQALALLEKGVADQLGSPV